MRRSPSSADKTEWVEGSGFRIVEEHLDRIRAQLRDGDWGEPEARQLETPRKKKEPVDSSFPPEDKYTPIPMRRSPTKGRSPGVVPSSPRERLQRADSVLPMSPPQIMSPPLEDILFFQSSSRVSLVSEERKSGLGRKTTTRSVGTCGERQPSKPSPGQNNPSKARRPGDVLPVTPPRCRPGAPRADKPGSRPALRHSSRQSSATGSRRSTAAERFHARHDALNKVDEIVSRSWSQRSLGEIERIGSPTMFGARV
jgi:hypothetical protein